MTINAQSAAIWTRSIRERLSLKRVVNMLVCIRHCWRSIRAGTFPFEQGPINVAGDGGGNAATATRVHVDFNHHQDGITRLLVRRKGSEPDGISAGLVLRI